MAIQQELWGKETGKAIENFPVSGERVPVPVVRWLGRIKAAAARVNAELGLLDAEVAERIARAGDEVANGDHDDQFPIDVFQTGSGTSSNMNANEVIANLAGDGAHPNDHVNMGQSSNDVFPSADRKSTRLNSSHANISYAVFCLKKKKKTKKTHRGELIERRNRRPLGRLLQNWKTYG